MVPRLYDLDRMAIGKRNMALIFRGLTRCAICNAVIEEGDEIVATPHFIFDGDDPFWRYSDAAMHRACFMEWPDGPTFRETYNRLAPAVLPRPPRQMRPDGAIEIVRLQ